MPARCQWHTQFELDPVCHWQQADTFLFLLFDHSSGNSLIICHPFYFIFNFYINLILYFLGMPARCQWHTQFELDLVCHWQQADTFFLFSVSMTSCMEVTTPLSIYRQGWVLPNSLCQADIFCILHSYSISYHVFFCGVPTCCQWHTQFELDMCVTAAGWHFFLFFNWSSYSAEIDPLSTFVFLFFLFLHSVDFLFFGRASPLSVTHSVCIRSGVSKAAGWHFFYLFCLDILKLLVILYCNFEVISDFVQWSLMFYLTCWSESTVVHVDFLDLYWRPTV